MDTMQVIGVAASVSLLSGWRLYLCILATGLALRSGWLVMPENLQSLDVLANYWVIAIAAVGTVAEFFADKVALLDTVWDTVHTLVRPIGGALLALAIVDPADPAWQVMIFLLGGGGALLAHGAKAGTRAAVNTSPEPFSNIAVSACEDALTCGALAVTLISPAMAIAVASVILAASIAAIYGLFRLLRG